MPTSGEPITLTLPRLAVQDMISLSTTLLDRMHDLLERNTNGELSSVEREELETLVQMAQFGQIISMALRGATGPIP